MIEIVSTCWKYSRLLTYHLSQYVLYPPTVETKVTIYWCAEDDHTRAVLEYFCTGDSQWPDNVCIDPRILPRELLMRRARSRNDACRLTKADVLVMTDVDYLYRGPVIDAIHDEVMSLDMPRLCYTPNILGNIDETYGDKEIERVTEPCVIDVQEDYVPRPIKTAIGGSQIVSGGWARLHGYIPRSKWHDERPETWQRTHEDPDFRRSCGLALHALEAGPVLRIRHTKKGRDDDVSL